MLFIKNRSSVPLTLLGKGSFPTDFPKRMKQLSLGTQKPQKAS